MAGEPTAGQVPSRPSSVSLWLTLRPHLQVIDWPGYTNPTHVKKVLSSLSVYCENRPRWDIKGLAHVQFEGDWEKAGPRVAYRYSHWIAYRWSRIGYLAYDVNYGEQGEGGWCRYSFWSDHVAPQLYPKRCTGHRVRQFIEVLG
jgi:hypothetical protein